MPCTTTSTRFSGSYMRVHAGEHALELTIFGHQAAPAVTDHYLWSRTWHYSLVWLWWSDPFLSQYACWIGTHADMPSFSRREKVARSDG